MKIDKVKIKNYYNFLNFYLFFSIECFINEFGYYNVMLLILN